MTEVVESKCKTLSSNPKTALPPKKSKKMKRKYAMKSLKPDGVFMQLEADNNLSVFYICLFLDPR
jgi:hypothetical protein